MREAHSAPRDEETLRQVVIRWGGAAAIVMAVHGGLATAIAYWPTPESKSSEPPAAVMVELAPLPVAPEVPQENIAVGEPQEISDESAPSERKHEPVEKTEAEVPIDPQRQEPTPEPVERVVETKHETPELPQVTAAEAVLESETRKSAPEPEHVDQKRPPKPEKDTESGKPRPQAKQAAKATSAPKPRPAPRAKTNAAPSPGLASSMSVAAWRGSVMAHLDRHKRYPGGGARGISSIVFTIDRTGRVLSVRLIRSSGSPVLDQEALALARRASPVPAPPPDIGRSTIVLTVPLDFSP